MNLASPKLGKHQYFHVPAHVARHYCLAGNIDEPERRHWGGQQRRCASGFCGRMADMEGAEPLYPASILLDRRVSDLHVL